MPEISKIMMPLAIALIMMGIGLSISFADFKRVFIEPKAVISGLFSQMLLLPIVGFLIAFLSPIDPGYKVGIILIASCPGGTASNLVTLLLHGRTALSISLTSFNSFFIAFTIPSIVGLGMDIFLSEWSTIELSFWNTFLNVAITVIIPVVIGLFINHLKPELAQNLKNPLRYVLPSILFLAFGYLLFFKNNTDYRSLISDNWFLFIPALILNLSTILLGYYFAGKLKLSHRSKYTIGIEMGLQNSALAIFIGEQLLESQEMVTVAIIYAGFSLFTTIALAFFLKEKMWEFERFKKVKNLFINGRLFIRKKRKSS